MALCAHGWRRYSLRPYLERPMYNQLGCGKHFTSQVIMVVDLLITHFSGMVGKILNLNLSIKVIAVPSNFQHSRFMYIFSQSEV